MDNSPENMAKIRNLAIEPYTRSPPDTQDQDLLLAKDTKTDKGGAKSSSQDGMRPFDAVVVLDPILTCAEDILELIFQSQLQNADLTCGMDLNFTAEHSGSIGVTGKTEQEVYGSAITRDMLGQRLHNDGQQSDLFSTDPETQTRFQKRLPFQVESCWSGAVVLRSTALSFSDFIQPFFHMDAENPPLPLSQSQSQKCEFFDDRAAFCENLWHLEEETQSHEVSPGDPILVSLPSSSLPHIPRMVVVPSIGFTYSSNDYASQSRFNGWGLWPKTEEKYRKELEAQLEAASHPMYGYRASTASYGYIPRVEEDELQGPTLDYTKESNDAKDENQVAQKYSNGLDRLTIPEEMTSVLKSKLEDIMAVFGVQDIQNAVLTKRDMELISEWRGRPQPLAREC
ncbi:capsular associated protein [Mortierella sp. AM989]|nr:capsular associated protein [Mortierella sp. AM989]